MKPRQAQTTPPELTILSHWEEFTSWFLEHTARWPKVCRLTLTHRLENHALDILEHLVCARFDRSSRTERLSEINLRLDRMRFLLRVARSRSAMSRAAFERAVRDLDRAGRTIHAWRKSSSGKTA